MSHISTGTSPAGDSEKDNSSKGQQYRFVEDFGEQMVGKHQTVIAIFNLETDDLQVLPRKKIALSKGTVILNFLSMNIEDLSHKKGIGNH